MHNLSLRIDFDEGRIESRKWLGFADVAQALNLNAKKSGNRVWR